MNALTTADYAIIIAYFILTMIAGMVMTRRAGTSLEHYFLGGRSMPWYLLGIAGMTAWFDLTGTMVITSFLYMLGPRGLFIEFRGGAVLVLAFLLAYAAKWHRRSGVMTGAEWMTYRFGTGSGGELVRAVSAIMGIIGTVGMLAYLVRGTSIFLGLFLPYPPMEMTIYLLIFTTIYTACAGFYGVILTDVIQGLIIIISCAIVGVMAFMLVPDMASLAATAAQVTGNVDWTNAMPKWHTTMPKGYEAYESLVMFSFFYLVRNVLGGMGSGSESRFFAAKNDKECGLQCLLQGVTVMLRWPMMIGFAIMGIYLVNRTLPNPTTVSQAAAAVHAAHPGLTAANWFDKTADIVLTPASQDPVMINALRSALGTEWPTRLGLVGFQGVIDPERILPAVLIGAIPGGLRGVLFVAMLAAMMSTFSSLVNGCGALVVKDLYQNFFRQTASNRELIWVSYLSTVLIVAAGFAMGVMSGNINELWGWLVMGFGAGSIAPTLLRLYWWRCNAWGIAGGLALGMTGAVLQRIIMPQMVEWIQFLLMSALSFVGTITCSLLTKPTDDACLRHFYRTTRPFGLWKPFENEFTGEARVELRKEHRNDIIAVPFTLLAQVTFFLLPMELMVKNYYALAVTLPLFLIGVVGMYIYWWRPLQHVSLLTSATAKS